MSNILKKLFKRKIKPVESKIYHKYDNITSKDVEALTEAEIKRIDVYRDYTMTHVEYLRYEAFCKDHKHCKGDTRSTIGGLDPIVSFVGTGLGNIVHCKCQFCGEECDITDSDCW